VRKIPDRTRFVARVYRRDEKDLFATCGRSRDCTAAIIGIGRRRIRNAADPSPRTMSQNFANQSAMRAAQPITRGGTVNPGLTGDHMQRGNNG
jgi:hypothetical protein